jgi:hypothetical protein
LGLGIGTHQGIFGQRHGDEKQKTNISSQKTNSQDIPTTKRSSSNPTPGQAATTTQRHTEELKNLQSFDLRSHMNILADNVSLLAANASTSFDELTMQQYNTNDSNGEEEEDLSKTSGSAKAGAFDMAYFKARLPPELSLEADNGQFTKKDMDYALAKGRDSIGDEDFNEFKAATAFNGYLHECLHYMEALDGTTQGSVPPEPPSQAAGLSQSPFRRTADKAALKKGSPTRSTASSTTEGSDLMADDYLQWSSGNSISFSDPEREAKTI